MGQHILVDSRCAADEKDKVAGQLSILLDLLIELGRRRAQFMCYFSSRSRSDKAEDGTQSRFNEDEDEVIKKLCTELPSFFFKLPANIDIADTIAIAAKGNPSTAVLTAEPFAPEIGNKLALEIANKALSRNRTVTARRSSHWLRVPALEIAVKGADLQDLSSILCARLK